RRAIARAAVRDVDAYVRRAQTDPDLLAALVAEATVNETYFFRDAAQFENLRASIVPDVLSRKTASDALTVWSAGCASGEEAYSLAILLEELGVGERSRIAGTDVSRAAIQRARTARYGAWSFR